MNRNIRVGFRQLLDEANSQIETLSVEQARALHREPDVQFVDLRDIRELKGEGKIPDAFHMPRGMLEFWIDPDSPYYKSVFEQSERYVFYCKSGWRSALATKTAQDMGLGGVCHIDGGFDAWKNSQGSVEKV